MPDEVIRSPRKEIIDIIKSWEIPNDIPYEFDTLIPLEKFYAYIKALEVISAFIVSNNGDVFWDILNRQQITQYNYEIMASEFTELFTCKVFDDSGITCELFDLIDTSCEEFDFREFYTGIDLDDRKLYTMKIIES